MVSLKRAAVSKAAWVLSIVICLVVTAIALVSGLNPARSALIAGGVVVFFFGSGTLVQKMLKSYPNGVGMAIVMTSYGVRIVAVIGILWWLLRRVEPALDGSWFAVSALAGTIGWITGVIVTDIHTRQPIYDTAIKDSSREDC